MQGWIRLSVLSLLVCAASLAAAAEPGKYLGPQNVVASKDGAFLYVLDIDAKQISVVTTAGNNVARTIALPAEPTGMALGADGKSLFVTLFEPAGSVVEVSAAGDVATKIAAGYGATAPVVSPDGKRLYTCNRYVNNVSVIDLAAKKQVACVPVIREPSAAAISPDGKTLVVGNLIPNDRADSYDVAAVISLIDTATNAPTNLRLPNGSGNVRGVCVAPDGKHAYIAHILSRYQMPTTQLERGWMNTNAMTILDLATKKMVNTVLLDDVDLGAANPWGIGTTADGKTVVVSHAGTHELSVINIVGVMEKLAKIPVEAKPADPAKYDGTFSSPTQADVPNDLAFLVDLRKRIRLEGNGPRGLAVVGNKVYVAMYYTDSLCVVNLDPKPEKPIASVALAPAPQLTVQRRGEMFFHDADLCFQHWQSCASCHPEARVDALNWDLMNDGMGNPKNNKSMLLTHKTPPAMWEGVRPTGEEAVRSGIRHIQFAVRPEADAVAIDEYLKSLKPVPSPLLVNGQLSESAKRGKALFNSERVGCAKCHPEATYYTDQQMHDVESRGQYDRRPDFDTPTLIECWRTAPYMHDGRYVTMKEVIKEGKHGRKHGEVEKLTEKEIDDLVEFILSL